MTRHSIDHPDVYVQLENAGFSVQLGRQNPFGTIPVDQTIEVTVNRDTDPWRDQRIQPQTGCAEPLLSHSRAQKYLPEATTGPD